MITVSEFIKLLQDLPEKDKKLGIEYIDFSWVDDMKNLMINKNEYPSGDLIFIS